MSLSLNAIVEELLPEAEQLLCELIRIPSIPGEETAALELLENRFKELGAETSRILMDNSLREDPAYSNPIPDIDYTDRYNLRCKIGQLDEKSKLIINAHLDVVPPSEGMVDAFSPRIEDGVIYGRGACDDKGPAVSVWLACAALKELGLEPEHPVSLHYVCEEENGGNGSLAMVRSGEVADACIVMEPTSLHPVTSIRGAIWFRIQFFGTAGHSGSPGVTRSALHLARRAMDSIEDYHQNLLEASRGFPLFDRFENPMPLTFGHLEAGNWPAAAPNTAVLEGVLGFLPNRTAEEICHEISEVLLKEANLEDTEFHLDTTYKHDCSVTDKNHRVAGGILNTGSSLGLSLEIRAFPASCDAVFYRKELEIPTVVFGPGNLLDAHSRTEKITSREIGQAATILAELMIKNET